MPQCLQQGLVLGGRQAGHETAGVGHAPIAAAVFVLDLDWAGPVAPRTVGIDMVEIGRVAGRQQQRVLMRPWSFPTVSV